MILKKVVIYKTGDIFPKVICAIYDNRQNDNVFKTIDNCPKYALN